MASGPVDKRLNYFDGQFLQAKDFIAEQTYHIDRQRLANQSFHTSGVMDGLEIEKNGDYKITVRSGAALDAEGRLIVLLADRDLDLPKPEDGKDKTWYVVISYSETEADPAPGGTGNTRWHERPNIELIDPSGYEATKDIKILVGEVVVSGQGTIKSWSDQGRPGAGIRVGGKLEVEELGLKSDAGASYLRSGAGGQVDLEGDLHITGALKVHSEVDLQGDLHITGALKVHRKLILKISNAKLRPGQAITPFPLKEASSPFPILTIQAKVAANTSIFWFAGGSPDQNGEMRPTVFFRNDGGTEVIISFEVFELQISELTE